MAELSIEGLCTLGRGPFDLRVPGGSCVAIGGPSGSGKTLLLRAIADLDPHTGRVSLDGRPASAFAPAEWRRTVGMLAAESRWWGERVRDHFAAHAAPAEAELAALGLPADAPEWYVERASTGERQRLALLRLLANQPRALLLDEPTAHLDAESTARVEAFLADYRAAHDAAVLWVAHDPAQAARVAERRLEVTPDRLVAAG